MTLAARPIVVVLFQSSSPYDCFAVWREQEFLGGNPPSRSEPPHGRPARTHGKLYTRRPSFHVTHSSSPATSPSNTVPPAAAPSPPSPTPGLESGRGDTAGTSVECEAVPEQRPPGIHGLSSILVWPKLSDGQKDSSVKIILCLWFLCAGCYSDLLVMVE